MRAILWVILLWALPVWGERLDLSREAAWELRLENGESYQVGQKMRPELYLDSGPVTTISADPMAGNVTSGFQGVTVLGASHFGETFRESYLRALGLRPAHGDEPAASCLVWAEGTPQDFWPGIRYGSLMWMRTTRAESGLYPGDEVAGRVRESLVSWEEQLGPSYARLSHAHHSLHLYRAVMADIGLQVEAGKVVALILMEPGQLRTQLLRRGDYREI